MAKTPPLKELIVNEIYPGDAVSENASDEEIANALKLGCTTLQHTSATIPMGANSDIGIVNEEGLVYDFKNLRIIDASIFPEILLINLNITCMMMAEKIADEIIGKFYEN